MPASLPMVYRSRLGTIDECGYDDCPNKKIPQQLLPGEQNCNFCHRPLNVVRKLRDEVISWSIMSAWAGR